ncbi:MAG: hypothetical protein HZB42_13045 [Sphingobacteriales bacterium]|nr:hypothetical protein [Sphingobacteriales bacterium]
MKRVFIFFIALSCGSASFGQDFNTLITQTSDTLSKKIMTTGKKKIAITDFLNIDESITQLGTFLSSEVSSELANLTDNQTKFRVLERANLDQIFKEKHLVNFADPSGLAKELGKIDAADALIFATITDFDGYYRVVIKMLDTKNGDALCSYKVSFVKTPSLENLNKVVVKKGGQSVVQPNQNPSPLNNSQSNVNTGTYGDFCFKNMRGQECTGCDAKISITKVGQNEVIKTINVRNEETSCMYDLAAGIYKITIDWLYQSREVKKEVKEIKVISGKAGTLEIQY